LAAFYAAVGTTIHDTVSAARVRAVDTALDFTIVATDAQSFVATDGATIRPTFVTANFETIVATVITAQLATIETTDEQPHQGADEPTV